MPRKTFYLMLTFDNSLELNIALRIAGSFFLRMGKFNVGYEVVR